MALTLDQLDPSTYTPEYNAQRAGYQLVQPDDGPSYWLSPDGERVHLNEDEAGPGGTMQVESYLNHDLNSIGYDQYEPSRLMQQAQKLGVSPQEALQIIYGQGTSVVNDPNLGPLIKAGTFNPNDGNFGWNLPSLEDKSFLANYGGALLMLPAVGNIAAAAGAAGATAGTAGAGAANTGLFASGSYAPVTDAVASGSLAGGAADLGWAANLTDMAGGSLAAPAGAGSAYAGLGGAAGAGLLGTAGTLGSALSAGKGVLDTVNGFAKDYGSLIGPLAGGALGAYGANQQANAYQDVANKYLEMGAPYRDMLKASYAPGFQASSIPGFNQAIDASMNSTLRGLSTQGNPFDNPGGLMEANKYVTGNVALPALNTYRSQLGSFGQLGTNTAGTADMTSANAQGGIYNAIGYGLNGALNPPSTTDQLISKLGALSQYKQNNSGTGLI